MSFGRAVLVMATKYLVGTNFNQIIWLGQQIIWVLQPNTFKSAVPVLLRNVVGRGERNKT